MNLEKMILLVEDNPDDKDLTLRALKKNNISNRVIVATDGQEALDFLNCTGTYDGRDPDDLPIVVLLDLKLPKVDGIEVLKQIRSNPRTKFLPVVVLTSSLEEGDLIRSYESGTNSYIRKPVDFAEFNDVVGNLGLYWLLLNENPPSGD